jgi:hypothetical protein
VHLWIGRELRSLSAVVFPAIFLPVVLMSAQIMIFLSDEVERMCDLLNINAQSYMVDSLQEEIHTKAVVRACTKFNTDNGMEIY